MIGLKGVQTIGVWVAALSGLALALAIALAGQTGRWIPASGGAVLDTWSGRVCAVDMKGVGYCDDYGRFRVTR